MCRVELMHAHWQYVGGIRRAEGATSGETGGERGRAEPTGHGFLTSRVGADATVFGQPGQRHCDDPYETRASPNSGGEPRTQRAKPTVSGFVLVSHKRSTRFLKHTGHEASRIRGDIPRLQRGDCRRAVSGTG